MAKRDDPPPTRRPERVGRQEAALILGVPERTVTLLARRGEIPGAAIIGRCWTFNEDRIRAWVLEKEREVETHGVRTVRRSSPIVSARPKRTASSWDIDRQYQEAMHSLRHPPRR